MKLQDEIDEVVALARQIASTKTGRQKVMNSLTPDVMEIDEWETESEGHIAMNLQSWGHSQDRAKELAKKWVSLREREGGAHLWWLWKLAVEHLIEMVKTAPKPLTADAFIDYEENDHGNAKLFVSKYGSYVRYCAAWGKWLIWDAVGELRGRWVVDETERIMAFARTIPEDMRRWVEAAEDEKEWGRRESWRKRCGNATRLKAMLELARGDASMSVSPDQLDANGWLLNCQSGTIELRDMQYKHDYEKLFDRGGRCREPRKEDLITKMAGAEMPVGIWKYEDVCPTWMAFLRRIFDGDEELIEFVQRAVGYSIVGDVSEEKIFFMYGTGANGKSTFVGVIQHILQDYAAPIDPQILVKGYGGERHPTSLADLQGRRFVYTTEVDRGNLNEAMVKRITSTDMIKARYMRQDFFEFAPTHTLWFAANHKPTVRDMDVAIWRRIILIPFTVRIPDEEQDKHIQDKLLEEKDGILYWMVRGCLKWQREGLNPPKSVMMAVEEYKSEMDVLGDFLNEVCDFGEDKSVLFKTLYQAYHDWCNENRVKAMSKRAMGQALQERELSFPPYRLTPATVMGARVYKGICIAPTYADEVVDKWR
ncbi:MAG: DNA primase family protein [Methermicoccaceae archaeon]